MGLRAGSAAGSSGTINGCTSSPVRPVLSPFMHRTSRHSAVAQTPAFIAPVVTRSGPPSRSSSRIAVLEGDSEASIDPQANRVPVRVKLMHQVGFGESVRLVGSAAELGSWQQPNAYPLDWTEGHVWQGVLPLLPGTYEFKCLTVQNGGTMAWENGPNRVIQVPKDAQAVTVACEWHRTLETLVEVQKQGTLSAPLSRPPLEAAAASVAELTAAEPAAVAVAVTSSDADVAIWSSLEVAAALSAAVVRQPGGSAESVLPSPPGVVAATEVSLQTAITTDSSLTGAINGLDVTPADLSTKCWMEPAGPTDETEFPVSVVVAGGAESPADRPMAGGKPSLAAALAGGVGVEDTRIVVELSSPVEIIVEDTASCLSSSPSEGAGLLEASLMSDTSSTFSSTGSAPGVAELEALPPPNVAAAEGVADAKPVLNEGSGMDDLGSRAGDIPSDRSSSSSVKVVVVQDPSLRSPPASRTTSTPGSIPAAASPLPPSKAASCPSLPDLPPVRGSTSRSRSSVDVASLSRSTGGGPSTPAPVAQEQQREKLEKVLQTWDTVWEGQPSGKPAVRTPSASAPASAPPSVPPSAPTSPLATASEVADAPVDQAAGSVLRGSPFALAGQDPLSGAAATADGATCDLDIPGEPLPEGGNGALCDISANATLLGSLPATPGSPRTTPPSRRPDGSTAGTPPSPATPDSTTSSFVSALNSWGSTVTAEGSPSPEFLSPWSSDTAPSPTPYVDQDVTVHGRPRSSDSPGATVVDSRGEVVLDSLVAPPAAPGEVVKERSVADRSVTSSTTRGRAVSTSKGLRLVAAAHMVPHIAKVDKGGEDAFFISTTGLGALGVADGVSGWADEGIDPADYSRALMHHAAVAVEEGGERVRSVDVIEYAQACTHMQGSSTISLAVMKEGNLLEVANVGDSGVRVVRAGQLMYASEPQQHCFNMPFQLSHPDFIENCDTAECASVDILELQEGDVVLLATDGLFDNMFDDELVQLVVDSFLPLSKRRGLITAPAPFVGTPPGTSPGNMFASWIRKVFQGGPGSSAGAPDVLPYVKYSEVHASELAMTLAETAQRHARDPRRVTPWSNSLNQQAYAWSRMNKTGGKMDDVTVVIGMVCK